MRARRGGRKQSDMSKQILTWFKKENKKEKKKKPSKHSFHKIQLLSQAGVQRRTAWSHGVAMGYLKYC
jgi:hypothetical protein